MKRPKSTARDATILSGLLGNLPTTWILGRQKHHFGGGPSPTGLVRLYHLLKARGGIFPRVGTFQGAANEIFALGIHYRGYLWRDLRSSVVLYGFVGVTLAWQLLFFAIARQPVRLRPVIPFAVLEKLSFGIGVMVIYRQGRLDHSDLYFGGIDLALAVLFMLAWWRLAPESTPG
jgi:hypothetical protein